VSATDTKIPRAAAWLGGLGAIPFVGLAFAVPFITGVLQGFAAYALLAYGAVILTFLGAVHWGLAIASPRAAEGVGPRLIMSVIPSLIGWVALLIGERWGLWISAAAIAAMFAVDQRAAGAGQAPVWYSKLRLPLTVVVVSALGFAAVWLTVVA